MSDNDLFVYEADGVKISAPRFDKAMTAGFVRRHRNDEPAEQMFSLVEEALDEANLAEFDKLSASGMEAFYTAWQEDSGVTAGE